MYLTLILETKYFKMFYSAHETALTLIFKNPYINKKKLNTIILSIGWAGI